MIRKEQEWEPLTFDEALQRVRQKLITKEMTYEERLKMLKRRYESMTREEQIHNQATNYGYAVAGGELRRPAISKAFLEGAEWADANQPSPWISVEERLPETTDEFGRSEDVLILDENGWRTVAMYCIPENKWYLSVGAIQGECEYPFEITHWMPIPELPKEG